MLKIITPCSRPENIKSIYSTIPNESKWIIVHDNNAKLKLTEESWIKEKDNIKLLECPNTGFCGIEARNFALDNEQFDDNDFILFHDDDNIIHKDLFANIKDLLNLNCSIVTWGQINKDNSIRLCPTITPKIRHIDTACFMIKWGINKHVRHLVNEYTHDGIYAEVCSKNGEVFVIDKYLSYYNYLRG